MKVHPEPKRVACAAEAGLRSDIGECAVAIVAVEAVLAEVSDEEIFEAVVVVVAHADADGPSGIDEASLVCDIGEGAVAIVVVEAVAGAGGNAIEAAAAEDEDIHPAIVVVVEETRSLRP